MQADAGDHGLVVQLLFALVLRLQSGSGSRHKHVVALEWLKGIERYEQLVGCDSDSCTYGLKVVPTKHICKHSAPVEFYLLDDISHYLFHNWWVLYCPLAAVSQQDNKYVFPEVSGIGKRFDFQKVFSPANHTQACMDCVARLGLQPAGDDRKYTSNCVRRGVAACLGRKIKQVVHNHNLQYGRAPGSRIDLEVYCPEEVLQASGPLFGDIDHMNAKLHDFIHCMAGVDITKCTVCGFPNCKCDVCGIKLAQSVVSKNTTKRSRTNAKGKHTCPLKDYIGKAGAPPRYGYYDEARLCMCRQCFSIVLQSNPNS